MTDKPTRKDLKEPDEFASKTQLIFNWTLKNWKLVALMAGGVVVCLLLVHAFVWYRVSKEKDASQLLVEALKILDSPVSKAPAAESKPGVYQSEQEKLQAALSSMQKVSETFGSTRTALLSRYFTGEIERRLGKYDEAIKSFKDFLAGSSQEADFSVYAMEGIGACLEAQGKLDEARAQYEAITKPPFDVEPDRALYNMARVDLQKGMKDKAVESFKSILDKYPDTALRRDIQNRLAAIGEQPADSTEKKKEEGNKSEEKAVKGSEGGEG